MDLFPAAMWNRSGTGRGTCQPGGEGGDVGVGQPGCDDPCEVSRRVEDVALAGRELQGVAGQLVGAHAGQHARVLRAHPVHERARQRVPQIATATACGGPALPEQEADDRQLAALLGDRLDRGGDLLTQLAALQRGVLVDHQQPQPPVRRAGRAAGQLGPHLAQHPADVSRIRRDRAAQQTVHWPAANRSRMRTAIRGPTCSRSDTASASPGPVRWPPPAT
ncbi:MAG: hypothetical protein ACRDZO_07720 [Egibacteraceae bacterium]